MGPYPSDLQIPAVESKDTLRHCLVAILIALVIPAGVFGSPAIFALFLIATVTAITVPDRSIHMRRLLLMTVFHPIGLLTIFLLLAWLPGILNSPIPLLSLKAWGREAFVIGGAVFLWSILDRNTHLQILTQKILLGSLCILLGLTVLTIHLYPEAIYALRNITVFTYGAWGKYKAFASALTCLFPIFVWLAWTCKDWQRWACLLLIGLSIHVIIATNSRSAVAGLAVAGILAASLLAYRIKSIRIITLIAASLFFVLVVWTLANYGVRHDQNTGPLNLPLWLIDYHRQHIWNFVGAKIPEAFWFGHGLNAIAHIPGADQNAPGLSVAFVPSHPHNWILEIFSETGIFGILGMVAIVSSFLLTDIKTFLKHRDLRALTRFTVFVAFWGSSCFNFSIWAPWWGVTFLVLMVILSARPEMPEAPKPKMLFSVTEGFAFMSHRLPMARAAKASGYDVGVICAPGDKLTDIESHGIFVHPWSIDRAGTNPIKEWRTLNTLRKAYETEQPALVHHVAVKPVLYGAIAAQIANVPMVVNAMIGLGFLFINKGQKASILRKLVLFLLKLTLDRPGSRLLVQNPDDAELFANSGIIAKDRIVLIPGSGVDASKYAPQPEPDTQTIIVSVVSRMLWDKGIGETVEAARLLQDKGLNVRIRLIGDVDAANPQCIPKETLQGWHAEGIVEWNGPRRDIQNVWTESHIALLPSYREGMPKALLEAAACARPLITTDAPGCRSLVEEGKNGLLVPLKDGPAIATAIEQLAINPQLRQTMGANARQRIENIYADPIIEKSVSALYDSLRSNEARA